MQTQGGDHRDAEGFLRPLELAKGLGRRLTAALEGVRVLDTQVLDFQPQNWGTTKSTRHSVYNTFKQALNKYSSVHTNSSFMLSVKNTRMSFF